MTPWRAAEMPTRVVAPDGVVRPAAGGDTSSGAPVRWGMALVLVSTTLFARFGINFGSYSLDFSLIALYGLLALLLLLRRSVIDGSVAVLYIGGVLVASASLLVNSGLAASDESSPSSLLLLFALYLPLVVTMPLVNGGRDRAWVIESFGAIAMICALAGIAQYFAQFAIKQPWLFDFTPWLPEILRGPSHYNTVIEVGSLHKANGFFLREPSSFSFVVALAAIIELNTARRWARIALFVFALLLSYSGTGVLALIIGLMFPLSRKSALRLLIAIVGALLVFWILGEALNLSFTANRVAEFGSERSSAYIRYIAPLRVVTGNLDSTPWSALLGHGPGTITRIQHSIESFDPTWAKLFFEYGALGFVAFMSLIVLALHRSGTASPLKAVLFASWLVMGGHLLSPENIATLYVLAAAWRPQSK